MKLTYTEGCIHTSLEVDDKDFNDLSIEERKEICHKIIDKSNSDYLLQEIFRHFVEISGESTFEPYPCECCGDIVTEKIVII